MNFVQPTTHTILKVAPELITPVWPQAAPLLEAALRARPMHDIEDVRLLLMGMHAQLWIQWRDPIVEAALVTEFASYPKGVWLRVWLDGALPGARQDDTALMGVLRQFADQNGCRGFEAVAARGGWMRRIPGAIYEGTSMRLNFED